MQAQQAVKQYKEAGVPLSECSVASDGFGSWPVYDAQGRLLSYEVCLAMFHRHKCIFADQLHATYPVQSVPKQLQTPDCNPRAAAHTPELLSHSVVSQTLVFNLYTDEDNVVLTGS